MEYAAEPIPLQDYRGHWPEVTTGRFLLRRHQRMRDGMHREGDTVLHAYFAHQLRDVSLYGALLNAQRGSDFLVGTAGHQHFQDFFFAVGKGHAASWKDSSWRRCDALNEHGKHAAGGPYRSLIHNADGLYEFRGRGSLIYIAFGTGGDRFQDGFLVHA